LDFHGTMEDYFASKRRLFRDFGVETAVVNRDDPWSVPLLDGIQTPTLTYSLEGRADIYARDIHLSQKGISLVACTSQEKIPLESPLMGRYNIYNILAAMGTACSLGVGQDGIREGTRALKGVPGRFERVETDQGFLVIVDYAHTEDALERILRTAKELNPACLITVFGCGGDRDKSKRPRMGQVATAYSDYTFITSDNPRGENPKTILQEIVEGARGLTSDIQEQRDKGSGARTPSPEPFEVIVDRREAIHRAVLKAKTGDIVVIAGKGHETYQILGNRTIHFDDREVAREAIQLGMKKERKPRWKD
jgi:UDP-N-acetylmuramoyl-L-alanyl-D-glutamate--2,6-diaminopimelate ligase